MVTRSNQHLERMDGSRDLSEPTKSTVMEEQEWEDVPEQREEDFKRLEIRRVDSSESLASTQAPSRSASNTPRKRRIVPRAAIRTIFVATSGAAPRKAAPKSKGEKQLRPQSQPIVSREEIHSAITHSTRSSVTYVYDVATNFFRLIKNFLAFFLFIWVVALILNALSSSIRTVFSPLCSIPFISSSQLCQWQTHWHSLDRTGELHHAEYPAMVELQSKTFEQLLDETVGSTSLALDIKKAEMATHDLVTLVRMSDLRSKDHLANALVTFSDDARETARGLQKLNAKISGSVDNILAISDFALQTIESGTAEQSSLMKYIWPFGSGISESDGKDLLVSTFTQSLSVLSASLERLILSAESSLDSLNKLEEQLDTIHGIVVREDSTLSVENTELLAALWTRLGGNRAKVARFASNLQLLKELGNYRAQALARVVAALQALQDLSAHMEELRERAVTPELAGDEIPVEVHARAIRNGVQRLNEGRLRAKELEEDAVKKVLGLED